MSSAHRILVVGVGSIGERHLRCFQETNRCDVGFCEPNESLRSTIAEKYGISSAAADWKSVLATEQYTAAVIATPAQLHVPIATQLAEHGLHLLIEKPVSTSLDGINRLESLVAEKKLSAAIGYTHRAHPANRAVHQAIQAGRFGQPLQVVMQGGQHFPTFRPAYREIYYTNHATGGGAIQDAMTHMFNLGEWLVGPIDRLVTDAAHLSLPGVTVEDTVHTLTRQGNVLGSYTLNQYQAPSETTVTVVCEEGTCRVDYSRSRWSWITEINQSWNHEPADIEKRDLLYIEQANQFLDFVEGSTAPFCTLAEGIQTLRVNLAALRSLEEGVWVDVK